MNQTSGYLLLFPQSVMDSTSQFAAYTITYLNTPTL